MHNIKIVVVAAAGWALAATSSTAQVTATLVPPPPPTFLEQLETNTGLLIIKGTAPAGTVALEGANVAVECKEDRVPANNQNYFGLRLAITIDGEPAEDRTIIDFDELGSLLGSLDFLGKIDATIMPLPSYSASYTTRGGLYLSAFFSKQSNQIEFSLRSARMSRGIIMTASEFAQLRTVLTQAKTTLDGWRKG